VIFAWTRPHMHVFANSYRYIFTNLYLYLDSDFYFRRDSSLFVTCQSFKQYIEDWWTVNNVHADKVRPFSPLVNGLMPKAPSLDATILTPQYIYLECRRNLDATSFYGLTRVSSKEETQHGSIEHQNASTSWRIELRMFTEKTYSSITQSPNSTYKAVVHSTSAIGFLGTGMNR